MATPRKKPEDKLKVGRHTKYNPAFCQGIIDFAAQGLTYTQFAASINISRETLYRWLDEYPEFCDAKKEADAKMNAWYEHFLQQNLSNKDVNVGLLVWFTKARLRWQEPFKEEVKPQATTTLESFEFNNIDPEGV